MNQPIKPDVYNVNSYTDIELYNILDLINPSDRELEAQIIYYIRKYQQTHSADSKRLEQFFQDIYTHFFITTEHEAENMGCKAETDSSDTDNISIIEQEGFEGIKLVPSSTTNTNGQNTQIIKKDPLPNNNSQTTINYTNSLTYAPNNLNPLLKQTIKRMVVVDSQFREWQKSFTTDFTVNFSEVLKDVVSVSLTSFQIPYTWYTINSDYGSNFIYIKGISPGINNGNHDYKIEILPGNYTNTEIIKALHDSIETLKSTQTDICLNNTDILYNAQNCKSTFNIGITNIYNFSNYELSFGLWKSPGSELSTRNTNIASFLGFNYPSYYANSFYSDRTISPTILDGGVNYYQIDSSSNKIYVIQYWDDISFSSSNYFELSNNILKYNTIPIELEINNKRSLQDIITDINSKMSINPKFDYTSSKLEKIDISLNTENLNSAGSSFFQWRIKLNRMNTINQLNSRIVVYFPNISNNIWVGPSSVFKFKQINELNNLVSETSVVNQSIDISGLSINLHCILPGYILPDNDISYTFPKSKITLNQLIDDINSNLFKTVGNKTDDTIYIYKELDGESRIKRKINMDGSSFALDNESKLKFTIDIINTIYGNNFNYDISGTFLKLGSVEKKVTESESSRNDSGDTVFMKKFIGKLNATETFTVNELNQKLITISSTNNTIMTDVSYTLLLPIKTINGIVELNKNINDAFRDYKDTSGSNPLNQSYFEFSLSGDFYYYSMNVIVTKILTESDYSLQLFDLSNQLVDSSTWYTDYKFKSQESIYSIEIPYTISGDTSYNIIDDNYSITSPTPINDNTYIYDLSGIYVNFTCIKPHYNTSGNAFQIHIDNRTNYTLTTFNMAFNTRIDTFDSVGNRIILSGTEIKIINNNLLKMVFNISKTFNISYFDNSAGNLLKNVLNNTKLPTYDNETVTFSGRLPYSNTYAIGTNTTIMSLVSKPLFNTEISGVSYTVPFTNPLLTYNNTNINDLFSSIETSVTNIPEFQSSTLSHNAVYSGTGLTNQFIEEKWINDKSSYITISGTNIDFNVQYKNEQETQILSTYLTNISYDVSLSFDVSYSTTASSSINRPFYITNTERYDNPSNVKIRIFGASDRNITNTNGLIPFTTDITSGRYRIEMDISAGDSIYFTLISNDNLSGNTEIIINNFSYTQSAVLNYPIYYDWSLNILYNTQLTEADYKVTFSDTHYGDRSIWYTYFNNTNAKITTPSTVINYKLQNYSSSNNSIITGANPVALDVIDLLTNSTTTSNILWVKPYSAAEGVYDLDGYNDISFNVPAAIYKSTEELINKINSLFDTNTITYGTKMSIIEINKYGYCQIRWNINKVYRTNDYKLVFYDTSSFLKCFAGNKSFRNSSPDSTLGWILGFQSLTEYILQDGEYYSDGYYIDPSYVLATKNKYGITYLNDVFLNPVIEKISLTGDTIVNVFLYKYLMIIIDDYTQNHLNDGLVTIAQKDTSLVLPSYASRSKYGCDPITGAVTNTGITSGATNNLTQNQLYSINQIINAQNTKLSLISAGPFVKDVFAMIPLDVAGMIPGQVFTDKATAIQDRVYFGPVNIHKLAVKLINDKGDVLDLNGANWSLQLLCEQLYQTSPTSNSNSNKTTE